MKLEGIWKGIKISDSDIKKVRRRLLRSLEKKFSKKDLEGLEKRFPIKKGEKI